MCLSCVASAEMLLVGGGLGVAARRARRRRLRHDAGASARGAGTAPAEVTEHDESGGQEWGTETSRAGTEPALGDAPSAPTRS